MLYPDLNQSSSIRVHGFYNSTSKKKRNGCHIQYWQISFTVVSNKLLLHHLEEIWEAECEIIYNDLSRLHKAGFISLCEYCSFELDKGLYVLNVNKFNLIRQSLNKILQWKFNETIKQYYKFMISSKTTIQSLNAAWL